MDTVVHEVHTGQSLTTDITDLIDHYLQDKRDGLINIFLPHATAGLAIMETGAGSELDLDSTLARLFPISDIYRHSHGSVGHGRDHVLPAFISPSVTIPVINGHTTLGIWQSIVLVDTNRDNPLRKLQLCFIEG